MKEHKKRWASAPNYTKLKELILHISKACQEDKKFGATKLNKILFYADFIGYLKFGHSISGDFYQRLKNGPAPKHLKPVKEKLIDRGELAIQKVEYFGKVQERTIALRDADLSHFNGDEIALVDELIRNCWNHSATSLSELTHSFIGFDAVGDGEIIPFETAFIENRELTPQEKQHGLSLNEIAKKFLDAA